jgi:hypothetical protein
LTPGGRHLFGPGHQRAVDERKIAPICFNPVSKHGENCFTGLRRAGSPDAGARCPRSRSIAAVDTIILMAMASRKPCIRQTFDFPTYSHTQVFLGTE